jgi:hypothetical protein
MKKNLIKFLTPFFIFMLVIVPGCKKKSGPVVKDLALLKLMPGETSGIFCIDVKRLTVLEYYKEMIAGLKKKMIAPSGERIFESYEDFIDKTGLDIETDIHAVAAAFFTGEMKDSPDGTNDNILMLIDLNYDRDKILSLLMNKKSGKIIDYIEEKYLDVNIIKLKNGALPLFGDRTIRNPAFTFINKSTIAVGKSGRIKQVIDLSKNKGKSILHRAEMESYLNMQKNVSMATFAFIVPKKFKKPYEKGLFTYDLTEAEIVSGNIDQVNGVWEGELKLVSKNVQANAQLASVLAFAKTVAGATLGAEFSGMIDKIHLISSEESVRLLFSIQHLLLKKLLKKIEKAGISPVNFPGEK